MLQLPCSLLMLAGANLRYHHTFLQSHRTVRLSAAALLQCCCDWGHCASTTCIQLAAQITHPWSGRTVHNGSDGDLQAGDLGAERSAAPLGGTATAQEAPQAAAAGSRRRCGAVAAAQPEECLGGGKKFYFRHWDVLCRTRVRSRFTNRSPLLNPNSTAVKTLLHGAGVWLAGRAGRKALD